MRLGTHRTRLTAVAIAAAVGGVLYLYGVRENPDPPNQAAPAEARVLVDASSRGAAVLSSRGIVGLKRDGTKMWQSPLTAQISQSTALVCTPQCRGLFASGSTTPAADDPAPLQVGEAELPDFATPASGGKNTLIAVGSNGVLRLVTSDSGQPTWRSDRPDGSVGEWPAAAGSVIVYPHSPEGTSVTVQIAGFDGATTTYLFHRSTAGWDLVADSTDPAGAASCVASDGRHWLLDGRAIADSNGREYLLAPSITDVTACGFTQDRLIVASNSLTSDGPRTMVTFMDLQGGVINRLDLDDEVAVSSSSESGLAALTASSDQTSTLFDGNGQEVRTIEDVEAALFVEDGDLCVLDREGHLTWVQINKL